MQLVSATSRHLPNPPTIFVWRDWASSFHSHGALLIASAAATAGTGTWSLASRPHRAAAASRPPPWTRSLLTQQASPSSPILNRQGGKRPILPTFAARLDPCPSLPVTRPCPSLVPACLPVNIPCLPARHSSLPPCQSICQGCQPVTPPCLAGGQEDKHGRG